MLHNSMLISCHSWTTQVPEIAMTDILICEIHIAWHAGMPIECLLLQSCMQREGSFGCQGLYSLAMNAMTSSLEYVNATTDKQACFGITIRECGHI